MRPYGSGFLIFSEYSRGAIRLSALMEIPVIHIFTHDSIGVGEDGPTHQPIEQLASWRAIPNLIVLRPADANEVTETWRVIMQLKHEPVALILTRQALPTIDRSICAAASGLAKGAYVLADAPGGKPDVLLLASGSDVSLCLEAAEQLQAGGIKARAASMPSWELFEHQPQAYRDSVIPPNVTARVCVEQASTFGWARYAGLTGEIIGMTSFGASAPLKELQKKFGFTVANVVAAAKGQIQKRAKAACITAIANDPTHSARPVCSSEPSPPGAPRPDQSSLQHLGSSARAVRRPQPAQTQHERKGHRTATRPLWPPYAHRTPHTFDTSRYTV